MEIVDRKELINNISLGTFMHTTCSKHMKSESLSLWYPTAVLGYITLTLWCLLHDSEQTEVSLGHLDNNVVLQLFVSFTILITRHTQDKHEMSKDVGMSILLQQWQQVLSISLHEPCRWHYGNQILPITFITPPIILRKLQLSRIAISTRALLLLSICFTCILDAVKSPETFELNMDIVQKISERFHQHPFELQDQGNSSDIQKVLLELELMKKEMAMMVERNEELQVQVSYNNAAAIETVTFRVSKCTRIVHRLWYLHFNVLWYYCTVDSSTQLPVYLLMSGSATLASKIFHLQNREESG